MVGLEERSELRRRQALVVGCTSCRALRWLSLGKSGWGQGLKQVHYLLMLTPAREFESALALAIRKAWVRLSLQEQFYNGHAARLRCRLQSGDAIRRLPIDV